MIGHQVRSIRSAFVVLGVTIGLAGCSTSNGIPTSPAITASDANVGSNSTTRFFKSAINPTTAAANTDTAFAITVTDCDTATCDASHATTVSNGIGIRSITIQVPAGFTLNTTPTVDLSAGWNINVVAGVIKLDVKSGNDLLTAGHSLVVSFHAQAPCNASPYEWTTAAYQDDDFVTTTSFERFGDQPTVTIACASECTYGFGFWKTHGPNAPGGQSNLWPTTALPMSLGTHSYTALELKSIMDAPVQGNGLISLAHQLIAAKLNIANGVTNTISATIAAADAMIGSLIVPPVGGGSLTTSEVEALKDALETFNKSNPCADDDPDEGAGV